jgi:hypothetical protein
MEVFMPGSTRRRTERSIGLALALAATTCHRPEEKPAPAPLPDASAAEPETPPVDRDLTWETPSRDSKIYLHQTHQPDGFCHLECVRIPDQRLWSGTGCVGKWLDLRFISDDCERIVVLHPFPKAAAHDRATPVARLFQHEVQVEELLAGGIVQNWSKVRTSGSHLYWLAGVLDMPGAAPHYSDDGSAVELDTLDGTHHRIPFAPPSSAAPSSASQHRTRRRR